MLLLGGHFHVSFAAHFRTVSQLIAYQSLHINSRYLQKIQIQMVEILLEIQKYAEFMAQFSVKNPSGPLTVFIMSTTS